MGTEDLLCSRNAKGHVYLVGGLSGLSGSPGWISGPINQINQIDEKDQMDQPTFDARSEGQPWPLPSREVAKIEG